MSRLQGMAGATGLFQFSPRVFENFLVLFVIRIDKVNSSQLSSIVKLWLFFRPFLFSSNLSGFTNCLSILLDIHDLVW